MTAKILTVLTLVSTAAFAIGTDPCTSYDPEMSKVKHAYACEVIETIEGDASEVAEVMELEETVDLQGAGTGTVLKFRTDFYGEEIKESSYAQKANEDTGGLLQFFGCKKAKASATDVELHAKPLYVKQGSQAYGYFEKAVISTDGTLPINQAYLTIDALKVDGVIAGEQSKQPVAGVANWKHFSKAKYKVKCRPHVQ